MQKINKQDTYKFSNYFNDFNPLILIIKVIKTNINFQVLLNLYTFLKNLKEGYIGV